MSKGSSPRPFSVALDKFSENWDNIFEKSETTSTCGCGRSPTGHCVGWHNLSEEDYIIAQDNFLNTPK